MEFNIVNTIISLSDKIHNNDVKQTNSCSQIHIHYYVIQTQHHPNKRCDFWKADS